MSFLNQNFDDSEDEDDNFNPAPADLSDEEDASPKVTKDAPRRRASEDASGNESEPERSASRRKSPQEDEDQDGEEEDEEEENTGRRRARDDDDEDEEDEEEDEEDEDDDEEEISGRPRKRSRREGRNQFLDVEAEVDEDEEDNEDDEDELNEIKDNFIAETHPDDTLPAGEDIDDRGHRELDRRREMEANLDAEKQAEILRQRYATKRGSGRGLGDSAIVPKRLLLPSVEDPSIWAVKCKEGKEREVVFSVMKRVEERMGTRQELAITSCFERGGTNSVMKGYIYVEAQRKEDVLNAMDGVMFAYVRSNMLLVNIKEMPSLLRVKKTPTLQPGQYVRMKRPPKYAGDLAQVIDVTETGLEIRIRFVPRLTYGAEEDLVGANDAKRKRPGAAGPRPPARLFSEVEAKKRHARYLQRRPDAKTWIYQGEEYVNGFAEKEVKIQHLVTTDVNPKLEEVTVFASGAEDGTESLDLNSIAASLKASTANASYQPGDVIEVYEGEQKGIIGKAVSVQGDIVTMTVFDGLLAGQSIEVPTKGLRKRFREGDHVKVIGGSRFRDEVGMVVKIVEDRVTLLSDQGNNEVTVFSKDLREASDSGGGGSLGQYELFDLVQLDPSTVGCIVKVDRESLTVLDQNSQKRTVMPSQISNKLERRKDAVATDRNGGEVRVDDVVKEHGGESRAGKIIHIHRAYLFLRSAEQSENSGVFVTRTTNVQTVSAKGGRLTSTTGSDDLTTMNPAMKINRPANNAMPPPRTFGRDRALGQTVTIRKGPYKGLLGIVKETNDTHARVELHTKGKTISVPKDTLGFRDKISGQSIDPNGRGGPGGGRGGFGPRGAGRGGPGPAAGWDGARTPAPVGGVERTPAWGSRTPAPNSGGRTPGWRQGGDGGRTPAWANDGSRTSNPYDGSRTAYGAGNRTPAWSASAKTPAYGMSDSYNSGSKTPGYGGGSGDAWGAKTPAYQSSEKPAVQETWSNQAPQNGWGQTPFDAPTPAPYSAPTPGALNAPTPAPYSAPTPGAVNAPTPAPYSAPTPAPYNNNWSAPTPGAMDAPTPGAYYGAPTPGAYNAPETPAANWQDDGPRYVD